MIMMSLITKKMFRVSSCSCTQMRRMSIQASRESEFVIVFLHIDILSHIIFILINMVMVMMWPRYMFMPAKSPFGDCGGNITDSENGFIKSPNYPEKYTTNDQSESSDI